MKYIIDLIDDMRENILNAPDYALLAILLKEDPSGELQYAGEKTVSSFHIDHDTKQLLFCFSGDHLATQELLETINALEMDAMMYEIMLKISDQHPLMPVVGFGENHEQKQYTFFVTT